MSWNCETKKLLTVLFLGGGVGVVVTVVFSFFFGPSGQYLAKHVLLSPDTIEQMEKSSISAGDERYHFGGIVLYRYDSVEDKSRGILLSSIIYNQFFNEIQNDQSLLKLSRDTEHLFYDPQMSRLVLRVKGDRDKSLSAFQEVHIPRGGDYYRVQLHQAGVKRSWVYFKHEGIARFLDEATGL